MGKFGEYIQPDIRHNSPGQPQKLTPYVPPKVPVKLPKELDWVPGASDAILEKIVGLKIKIVEPYHYFPPFYHTPIDMLEHVQLAAGAVGTVISLRIPQDSMARIRFYGQDITPVVAPLPGTEWLEVEWTFRVNGAPLNYYDRFLGQRGALIWPAETTIVLDGSDLFEVVARNTAAATAYYCWASIRGWQWSKSVREK
jgi:hypothetical protein